MRHNQRNQSSTRLDVDALRREASIVKKQKNIQHARALDLVAKKYGFAKWTDLVAAQNSIDRTEQRRVQHAPQERGPRFSLEDQPPEGAHHNPFDNPAYVRRILRP